MIIGAIIVGILILALIILGEHISNRCDGSFYDGECTLFPSRDERDWSKFKPKKPKQPKFDPKTLQPFDKVLTRNISSECWSIQFFSYIIKNEKVHPVCIAFNYKYCIPYNDDTKHLIGTTDEAPEFYRYWED